ncbi:hypothetical protein B0H14DRAFT_2559182 [Mycena olivaceomarginata]|nr:hypothetical protein B0H14DRAFT_2559182 [Mycena olivaceomarginata]
MAHGSISNIANDPFTIRKPEFGLDPAMIFSAVEVGESPTTNSPTRGEQAAGWISEFKSSTELLVSPWHGVVPGVTRAEVLYLTSTTQSKSIPFVLCPYVSRFDFERRPHVKVAAPSAARSFGGFYLRWWSLNIREVYAPGFYLKRTDSHVFNSLWRNSASNLESGLVKDWLVTMSNLRINHPVGAWIRFGSVSGSFEDRLAEQRHNTD